MIELLIITGGTKGIGNHIAQKCLPISKEMILIGSSGQIEKPVDCSVWKVDLRNFEQAAEDYSHLLGAQSSRFQSPKEIGIVLCASTIGEHGGLLSSDLKDWNNTYSCNVLGNLAIVKETLKKFGKTPNYRIVFFAGGGAAYGYPDFSGYALSKVATVRVAENLSIELKKEGYQASVISLSPGAVETQMLKKVKEHGGEIKTQTHIDEPAMFVHRFLNETFDQKLNGRFLHVRDDLMTEKLKDENHFKLRRIM